MYEGILKDIIKVAKNKRRKIVLPESSDKRVLEAASIIKSNNIADVILIGNKDEIFSNISKFNITNFNDEINIIDPNNYSKTDEYINKLYEIRKEKGMTISKATELVKDYVYFATMMIKCNDADGMVCGAIHSTSDTLRPALQIIKAKEGINTVSAFFLMETKHKEFGENGVFIFADCGLNPTPDVMQLCDITIESANSFRNLVNAEPRVALLSYSTKGSAKGENIDKIVSVLENLNKMNLDFKVDGELQLDAAIIPEVASLKAPNSKVAGKANILIFPDLEAGNIGYKIAQRFGEMLALGPITQGLNKPVNDLSRGCSVDDIVGAVAITCVQVED